jgi:hypothetical protein
MKLALQRGEIDMAFRDYADGTQSLGPASGSKSPGPTS